MPPAVRRMSALLFLRRVRLPLAEKRSNLYRMDFIPEFPDSIPVTLDVAAELERVFRSLPDGVSEFSFAGIYLFRNRYNYRLSSADGVLIILGEKDGERFFITPSALPPQETVSRLLETRDVWKLISPSLAEAEASFFDSLHKERGFAIREDRDNFDYLYHRRELADLPGKAFHKKKNRVNAFIAAHPRITSAPLSPDNAAAAKEVLDDWASRQENPAATDYAAAAEALSLLGNSGLHGFLVFADGAPVAWCLSEFLVQGTVAAVHFEKARIDMPGAFQYINYAFARSLPESVLFINREQDLGDEGMRQAKLTYRPCGFVKKFRIECERERKA